MKTSRFANKWIWITGASAGLGEAAAREWFKRGANVVLSARSEEKLKKIQEDLDPSGNRSRVVVVDLMQTDKLKNIAAKVIADVGAISLLYNNGGMSQRASALDTEADVLERLMRVNFLSQCEITRHVLPSMIENGGGTIVVTSSVAGKIGTKRRSGYAASKHALHGWFDSLREEHYHQNIQVTITCPGYIKTDISLNAVTADGSANQKMDSGQETGMPVDEFAVILADAVEKGEDEVYIGGKETFGIYLKRYVPFLLKRVLRNIGQH